MSPARRQGTRVVSPAADPVRAADFGGSRRRRRAEAEYRPSGRRGGAEAVHGCPPRRSELSQLGSRKTTGVAGAMSDAPTPEATVFLTTLAPRNGGNTILGSPENFGSPGPCRGRPPSSSGPLSWWMSPSAPRRARREDSRAAPDAQARHQARRGDQRTLGPWPASAGSPLHAALLRYAVDGGVEGRLARSLRDATTPRMVLWPVDAGRDGRRSRGRGPPLFSTQRSDDGWGQCGRQVQASHGSRRHPGRSRGCRGRRPEGLGLGLAHRGDQRGHRGRGRRRRGDPPPPGTPRFLLPRGDEAVGQRVRPAGTRRRVGSRMRPVNLPGGA